MQDAHSKPSKARDEYLAALNEQKPLEDTSKQDFWRTIGEMSSKLTENSLQPGATLLGSLAGATSVLPGSVSRSIENKKAREDAAKADRLNKLATMYGIDTNDRAAMADLAKTAFDMTQKQAEMLETLRHNREVEKKGRDDADYQRFMDNKQFELKALEARMKENGGKELTGFERNAYQDLRDKGYSPEEAYKYITENRGSGAGESSLPSVSDYNAAEREILMEVFSDPAMQEYSFGSPEFKSALAAATKRRLALSGKIPNYSAEEDIDFGGNQ